jgi:hypothetical protein
MPIKRRIETVDIGERRGPIPEPPPAQPAPPEVEIKEPPKGAAEPAEKEDDGQDRDE